MTSVWIPICLLCGLLCGSWGCDSPAPATPAANAKAKVPLEVEWVSPDEAELVEHEEFSGRLVAAEAVDIKARVSGPLEQILFRDGDDIEAGAPLFELDDRPYVAEQERAEASVKMQSARLDKLRRQERRSARLLETRSISQEDYDDIVFDLADPYSGLAAAGAALRLAELNMGYTRISSRIA
ncbi:MAG: efflux RND transporter periplasmic adaptor subunit, partial [Planctomycetaceae bacterium]